MESQNDDDKQAPATGRESPVESTKKHVMEIDDDPKAATLRELFGKDFELSEISGPLENLIDSIAPRVGSSPLSPANNLLRLLAMLNAAPDETKHKLIELALGYTITRTDWYFDMTRPLFTGAEPDGVFVFTTGKTASRKEAEGE